MSLNYFCFGLYWRNLTSPLTHWQRGTTVQIDTMKDHPEMQVVVAELGTDVVVLTMAARITQSIFTLARNLLHKRPWGWKIIPDWRSKVFKALLWMCWNIIDALLAVEVTNVLVYKNFSKHSTHYHTEQSMNTVSIKCHWACKAELNQSMVPEKELLSPRMEKLQGNADMEDAWDHKVFSDMDIMVSKETLLPSCTNPFILSMICVPSEDGESSLPSEESELSDFESDGESDGECLLPCEEYSLSESESEDEEPEKDSSLEETSVDSGMQESWTPKSKEDVDGSEEESDWSDEEDDSWDAASDLDGEEDDLWASFCRNDDPYNPLSFAMPTRSPTQVKEMLVANSEKHQIRESCSSIQTHEHQTSNCTMQSRARKPVFSSFKCSHKCANQKDEPGSIELNQTGNTGVKKVRFSSDVTVHCMVKWSYAYRMARKGPWEEYARDRSRFQKRIAESEAAIGFCLEPQHREKIWAASHCQEWKSVAEGTLCTFNIPDKSS